MEEIELNILKLIYEVNNKTHGHYAGHDIIAQSLGMSNQDICDFLEMLKRQGYVILSESVDGPSAMLTSPGRLMLTHPEYMLKKGFGDAGDVLKALEKAVIDSGDIPESEKDSLIENLKDLYHDPYIQSIGSGLILEGLKKVVGL